MNLESSAIEAAIKAKVVEIAAQLGDDASSLEREELIPASGLIDSAGLLELIAWFERHYDFRIPAEDVTIDKLGSLADMASYVRHRKGQA